MIKKPSRPYKKLKRILYLSVVGMVCLLWHSGVKAQSLDEFLQSAYDNHPELLYQLEGVLQQYDDAYGGVAARFLPSLTYSYRNSYTRENAIAPATADIPAGREVVGSVPLPAGTTTVSVPILNPNPIPGSPGGAIDARKNRTSGWNLQLQQNLFRSFGDVQALRAFLDNSDALQASYYANEQGFLLNAIDAYLNVIRRRNVVMVRLTNYESLQERLAVVERLYGIGDATELDLQQSRAQLLSARSQWEQAVASYEGAVANFRRYSGMEPEEPQLPDAPDNLPLSQEDGEDAVLTGNYELRSLQLARKIAKSTYRGQQTATGLQVDLNLTYQDGESRSGVRGRTSSVSEATSMTTVVTASLPLYDPQASSRIRSAYQNYLRSRNNYDRRRLENMQNFQAQWANYNRSIDVVEYQRQAVEAARIALDNVVVQQRAGLRSVVEVLDEETRLIQAQVAYEDARYGYLISGYQILLLTGRLTAKDLGLQTTYDAQLANYFNKQKFFGAVPAAWTVFETLADE